MSNINQIDVDSVSATTPTTEQNTNSTRNATKRPKQGDDSFELEHRVVNIRNQYFNSAGSRSVQQKQQLNPTTSHSAANYGNSTSTRSTFPPFRISFAADSTPSELSIIKDINKHCHIGLSYGRYTSTGSNKCFLIYANSSEQFDRLMDKTIWPIQICSLDYEILFPSKVPTSYSIVAIGVPAQWKLEQFESDIKKQYPTIIKVERLYVKDRIPISKVRIDFSSNQEVKKIIQNKCLLLDDENTSFMIQPYSPPAKILRCFNCQQYNDHIAANCPHKDKPICFRCSLNHPFNPNCSNKICCANCGQSHMAGSPSCPVKVEERRKFQQFSNNLPTINNNNNKVLHVKSTGASGAWATNARKEHTQAQLYTPVHNVTLNEYPDALSDINKKLDQIMNKMEQITNEQTNINASITKAFRLINSWQKDLASLKEFIIDKVCPYIFNLGEAFLGAKKQTEQEKLRPIFMKFKQQYEEIVESHDIKQNAKPILSRSTSNESIST
ncbi:unnamed protein product [Rotaria sp. Silwood2]|nr:unnamed protein product [Rotaria sp. Silwood2]CAF4223224.1 unnamed protein product [Rotaria sp. Silwood2]CAF4317796.1 unnamed protein product [Rotaria sp. Silwood2]